MGAFECEDGAISDCSEDEMSTDLGSSQSEISTSRLRNMKYEAQKTFFGRGDTCSSDSSDDAKGREGGSLFKLLCIKFG